MAWSKTDCAHCSATGLPPREEDEADPPPSDTAFWQKQAAMHDTGCAWIAANMLPNQTSSVNRTANFTQKATDIQRGETLETYDDAYGRLVLTSAPADQPENYVLKYGWQGDFWSRKSTRLSLEQLDTLIEQLDIIELEWRHVDGEE